MATEVFCIKLTKVLLVACINGLAQIAKHCGNISRLHGHVLTFTARVQIKQRNHQDDHNKQDSDPCLEELEVNANSLAHFVKQVLLILICVLQAADVVTQRDFPWNAIHKHARMTFVQIYSHLLIGDLHVRMVLVEEQARLPCGKVVVVNRFAIVDVAFARSSPRNLLNNFNKHTPFALF